MVYFFFYMNFKGAIYVKALLVSLGIIILINLRTIAISLASFFTSLNLSTRILEKVGVGELGNDTQRSDVRDVIYNAMNNGDHFWGLGLFGCRNHGVIYPHFLPLDFACTFGYLTGYTLLLLLFLLIAWALWITKGRKAQVFIVFLFSLSIIKLMFSSTFIAEPFLYILIGVCVKEILFSKPWLLLSRQSD